MVYKRSRCEWCKVGQVFRVPEVLLVHCLLCPHSPSDAACPRDRAYIRIRQCTHACVTIITCIMIHTYLLLILTCIHVWVNNDIATYVCKNKFVFPDNFSMTTISLPEQWVLKNIKNERYKGFHYFMCLCYHTVCTYMCAYVRMHIQYSSVAR